ncbi:uncharacterized protein LOC116413310 [Galleria mellonella]|uniref:Uncharacterized protein LOC116413310 n=1 Tax=Galleria mellonella TaxID=7137 RepID=A0A6J3C949_GALME|nr:uncharacterized protein LOC116413310 [Galleria mellonella]
MDANGLHYGCINSCLSCLRRIFVSCRYDWPSVVHAPPQTEMTPPQLVTSPPRLTSPPPSPPLPPSAPPSTPSNSPERPKQRRCRCTPCVHTRAALLFSSY